MSARRRGAALLASVAVSSLVLGLVVTTVSLALGSHRQAGATRGRARAAAIAEAGLDEALSTIPTVPQGATRGFDGGTYVTTVTQRTDGSSIWDVRATGTWLGEQAQLEVAAIASGTGVRVISWRRGPPAPPAAALFTTDFSNLTGWTTTSSVSDVVWAADATPSTMPGGAARSGTSLNFNDGFDYAPASGAACSGDATSPAIDLAQATTATPKLRFWCNYRTETTGTAYDQRYVRVMNEGLTATHTQRQLSTTSGGCGAMGTWHSHEVTLDRSWGRVKLRFSFDTIDSVDNNFQGWFVDDLSVGD